MDNILQKKEQELSALQELFNDLEKTINLENEISKEKERIAELEKNVNTYDIEKPQATAEALRTKIIAQKQIRAPGAFLLPIIFLLVSLAAMIYSGYLVFNYLISVGYVDSFLYGTFLGGVVPSAIIATIAFEIPFVIVAIVFALLSGRYD